MFKLSLRQMFGSHTRKCKCGHILTYHSQTGECEHDKGFASACSCKSFEAYWIDSFDVFADFHGLANYNGVVMQFSYGEYFCTIRKLANLRRSSDKVCSELSTRLDCQGEGQCVQQHRFDTYGHNFVKTFSDSYKLFCKRFVLELYWKPAYSTSEWIAKSRRTN
jgi:hypothetical protein